VLLGVGEAELDLAYLVAGEAAEPRHFELELHRFGLHGQSTESALHAALNPDLVTAAAGTAQAFARLIDAEDHVALLEALAAVVIAGEAEGVVQ
jgi:hypothetical protein